MPVRGRAPGGWQAGGAGMGSVTDLERLARAQLSELADPGDPVLGALLARCEPAELIRAVSAAGAPQASLPGGCAEVPGLDRAFGRWRRRLPGIATPGRLDGWQRSGLRLVCPGEPEWPTQLDDLGEARPVLLWLRGDCDLRFACLRSVSVVGSRAATGYGLEVALELAAELSERGYTVVSGGAYGIDTRAHQGALVSGGCTVAVLASGLGYCYPQGQHGLFEQIAGSGVLVSECPPDRPPTRPGFLIRNRLIAALSRGTVVVQAALRSGALNTARHARELCRPVMAVPGPVTTEQSAGCHELIMSYGAACVTAARDVIEHVSPPGTGGEGPRFGPSRRRDSLDPVMTAVLEAVPASGGRGAAEIAIRAGIEHDAAVSCLGRLAGEGFVQRGKHGWRAVRQPEQDQQ